MDNYGYLGPEEMAQEAAKDTSETLKPLRETYPEAAVDAITRTVESHVTHILNEVERVRVSLRMSEDDIQQILLRIGPDLAEEWMEYVQE
jgi:hypothetical protein